MNICEALFKAKRLGQWARPITWRVSECGLGFIPECGICWHAKKGWIMVPDLRGGYKALLPCPDDLKAEWEVFDPREGQVKRYEYLKRLKNE